MIAMAKGSPPPVPLLDRMSLKALGTLRRLRRKLVPELLEYAPLGWNTPLPAGEQGWLSAGVLAEERRKWTEFAALADSAGPLGFSHEAASLQEVDNLKFHNLHLTFGYVLLKSAFGPNRRSVLDWW
jgi:hypothetical protein